MDLTKMFDAHESMGKCLRGKCDHSTLSKCMDNIGDAHKTIGGELRGEAEKSMRAIKGEIVNKKFGALGKGDSVEKVISTIRSNEPTLVD